MQSKKNTLDAFRSFSSSARLNFVPHQLSQANYVIFFAHFYGRTRAVWWLASFQTATDRGDRWGSITSKTVKKNKNKEAAGWEAKGVAFKYASRSN